MSHLHKVILVLLCVVALFYFDSKETTNARNNNKFHADSDVRVRLGSISVRSICVLATKRKRTRVKCPDCKKWVKDVGLTTYSCPDSNIKRGFVFIHGGRT